MSVHCPSCGEELSGKPSYCPDCGESTDSDTTQAGQPDPLGYVSLISIGLGAVYSFLVMFPALSNNVSGNEFFTTLPYAIGPGLLAFGGIIFLAIAAKESEYL